MAETVIKVENLSKLYRLGEIGTGTITHDFNRWLAKVRGKEDPYLKIGASNDRTSKSSDSDYVWALKDINFEISQGDVVGIIGKNGAGKSTLLKILSRTTTPTSGSLKAKGRIASLLEVGTGFHPELSGRENIFLNGAILGMRKHEIKRKFDEIVAFAGVERYIDTPVKRYSSGMYVRLAFAVAAHLESEILIVDEVLAVGDNEFQKKCLGKMGDVSSKEGRTVLFVSHDMNAISTLTKNSILLKNGEVWYNGDTNTAISYYLSTANNQNRGEFVNPKLDTSVLKPQLHDAQVVTSGSNHYHIFNEPIKFKFNVFIPYEIAGFSISFQILDSLQKPILYSWYDDSEKEIIRKPGMATFECVIDKLRLYQGRYTIRVNLGETKGKTFFGSYENICEFDVEILNKNNEWGWPKDACYYIDDFVWSN